MYRELVIADSDHDAHRIWGKFLKLGCLEYSNHNLMSLVEMLEELDEN